MMVVVGDKTWKAFLYSVISIGILEEKVNLLLVSSDEFYEIKQSICKKESRPNKPIQFDLHLSANIL